MISVNAKSLARLAAVAIGTVLIQTSVVSRFELVGSNVDITPLVVAAIGFYCGALPGASFGFALGVFADLVLGGTLGVSSLVFLTVGYGAGRVRDLRDPEGPFVAPAVAAGATLASLAGFGLVSFVLGIDSSVSTTLIWLVLAAVVLNVVAAIPTFAVVRRLIFPVLFDDPRPRRRRRAYTTGGLSPLKRPDASS
jgi:rod shape-determining protein MreD